MSEGTSWRRKHPVELGLGRVAGALAVVQVDDGAGEEALGVDRRERAVGQSASVTSSMRSGCQPVVRVK